MNHLDFWFVTHRPYDRGMDSLAWLGRLVGIILILGALACWDTLQFAWSIPRYPQAMYAAPHLSDVGWSLWTWDSLDQVQSWYRQACAEADTEHFSTNPWDLSPADNCCVQSGTFSAACVTLTALPIGTAIDIVRIVHSDGPFEEFTGPCLGS